MDDRTRLFLVTILKHICHCFSVEFIAYHLQISFKKKLYKWLNYMIAYELAIYSVIMQFLVLLNVARKKGIAHIYASTTWKKIRAWYKWPLGVIHQWPVDSPQNVPVMRKTFPRHDVIPNEPVNVDKVVTTKFQHHNNWNHISVYSAGRGLSPVGRWFAL